MWNVVGGRKSAFILVAMLLVALHEVLRLDEGTVQQIVWLALGGGGLIAVEDVASHFSGRKKKGRQE